MSLNYGAMFFRMHGDNMETLEERLTTQLRRDEGEVLYAYQDHLGYWTIGVGRMIDKKRDGGISKEESAYLLNNDLKRIMTALDQKIPWWRSLDDARKGVLVNMAFQMGITGLMGFVNTLAMIRAFDFDGAAKGMLNSKWARAQTPARAYRLSQQMKTGEWQ